MHHQIKRNWDKVKARDEKLEFNGTCKFIFYF